VADEISLALSRDQALVLFEWLARAGVSQQPVPFEDQAEQRVLWDLESLLEAALVEPLRSDYRTLVERARERLRDGGTSRA
jgi:hypothetical protein